MTVEERDLDQCLAELGERDRTLHPSPELEQRIMARVRLRPARPTRGDASGPVRWAPWAVAALAAGVFVSAVLLRPSPRESSEAAVHTGIDHPAAQEARPVTSTEHPGVTAAKASLPQAVVRRTPASRAPKAPAEREVLDFVPLVPMDRQELSGPFQIVRVQLSRGQSGPVQADVLLGEDGLARAIRISTTR